MFHPFDVEVKCDTRAHKRLTFENGNSELAEPVKESLPKAS
jgi:hypothetical protein